MNDQPEQEKISRKAEAAARAAVERGVNIHDEVRDITLKALSDRHLDVQKMREVVQAVLQGASMSAQVKEGTQSRQVLLDVMAGVDEALAKSAEATKLAIEEAAGHLKDFGSQDFKRALDDLLTLEDIFLDTVNNFAKASGDTVGNVLIDLVQHASNSGTMVGKVSTAIIKKLNRQLEHTLHETVTTGSDAAQRIGVQLSQAAAGFLEGIAETLKAETQSNKKE